MHYECCVVIIFSHTVAVVIYWMWTCVYCRCCTHVCQTRGNTVTISTVWTGSDDVTVWTLCWVLLHISVFCCENTHSEVCQCQPQCQSIKIKHVAQLFSNTMLCPPKVRIMEGMASLIDYVTKTEQHALKGKSWAPCTTLKSSSFTPPIILHAVSQWVLQSHVDSDPSIEKLPNKTNSWKKGQIFREAIQTAVTAAGGRNKNKIKVEAGIRYSFLYPAVIRIFTPIAPALPSWTWKKSMTTSVNSLSQNKPLALRLR